MIVKVAKELIALQIRFHREQTQFDRRIRKRMDEGWMREMLLLMRGTREATPTGN